MTGFSGLGTAMVTPFQGDGSIHWDVLRWLVDMQIKGGVDFLVPCGTTGESPTLSHEEHMRVGECVVREAGGRVPVLAGTGSNSTSEAVFLTESAKSFGASGVLVVSPYYNKPTPRGFVDYFAQIAQVGLPVILYDIPGRTAKGVPTDIMIELAREGLISGIKWASGDFNQLMDVLSAFPKEASVLSGDDNLTFPLMGLGGHGVISVLSNLIPGQMSQFVCSMRQGRDWEKARKTHFGLLPLMRSMFIETNPIPVKTALALVYPHVFSGPNLRSPMFEMEKSHAADLEEILKENGLLK